MIKLNGHHIGVLAELYISKETEEELIKKVSDYLHSKFTKEYIEYAIKKRKEFRLLLEDDNAIIEIVECVDDVCKDCPMPECNSKKNNEDPFVLKEYNLNPGKVKIEYLKSIFEKYHSKTGKISARETYYEIPKSDIKDFFKKLFK